MGRLRSALGLLAAASSVLLVLRLLTAADLRKELRLHEEHVPRLFLTRDLNNPDPAARRVPPEVDVKWGIAFVFSGKDARARVTSVSFESILDAVSVALDKHANWGFSFLLFDDRVKGSSNSSSSSDGPALDERASARQALLKSEGRLRFAHLRGTVNKTLPAPRIITKNMEASYMYLYEQEECDLIVNFDDDTLLVGGYFDLMHEAYLQLECRPFAVPGRPCSRRPQRERARERDNPCYCCCCCRARAAACVICIAFRGHGMQFCPENNHVHCATITR
jgi:hypothetical protein